MPGTDGWNGRCAVDDDEPRDEFEAGMPVTFSLKVKSGVVESVTIVAKMGSLKVEAGTVDGCVSELRRAVRAERRRSGS
jgi:hypothetical protein